MPKVSKYLNIKWELPNLNQVKLNFDGSVQNDEASIGFIVRNSDGIPLVAANKRIGQSGVLVAEAIALREGLHMALLHQHQNLLVEGDFKLLIDYIQGKSEVPWCIKALVQDIKQLAQQSVTGRVPARVCMLEGKGTSQISFSSMIVVVRHVVEKPDQWWCGFFHWRWQDIVALMLLHLSGVRPVVNDGGRVGGWQIGNYAVFVF
ncbi:uncharacterized protein LOC112177505 [Rosa chinensis]|uniref:uncharacterized protein LOC112177505 n=1 Tax=Rosa chinensis TaxID=74649 RepID=UPI000D0920DB|nr:uncharacterized protein LOC112177505 [Rosa chinensis]